jgi:hypothetical protein
VRSENKNIFFSPLYNGLTYCGAGVVVVNSEAVRLECLEGYICMSRVVFL